MNITQEASTSIFHTIDEQIKSSTGKELVTYKKETVALIALNSLEDLGFKKASFTKPEILSIVNEFVDYFKNTLKDGKAIVITNHGKLVPRIKKGGRPVRDLSRKSQIIMKDVATVTFSKTHKTNEGKVTSKGLVLGFSENFSGETAKLAKYIATIFLCCVRKTANATHRMEVRGLGVFYSKNLAPRTVRNPKTGLETVVKRTTHPRFRVSRPLRCELASSLAS